jgi:peroxiredoxin
MRVLFSIFFFLVTSSVFSQVRSLPEFRFFRMDNGAEVTHKNVTAGKKTLFVFFDTECPHCRVAITEYNHNQAKLNDINVFLITRDQKSVVNAFLNEVGSKLIVKKNVTVLSDNQNQFIGKFLPKKFPSMFLFGANRQLLIYTDEEKDIPVILEKIKS